MAESPKYPRRFRCKRGGVLYVVDAPGDQPTYWFGGHVWPSPYVEADLVSPDKFEEVFLDAVKYPRWFQWGACYWQVAFPGDRPVAYSKIGGLTWQSSCTEKELSVRHTEVFPDGVAPDDILDHPEHGKEFKQEAAKTSTSAVKSDTPTPQENDTMSKPTDYEIRRAIEQRIAASDLLEKVRPRRAVTDYSFGGKLYRLRRNPSDWTDLNLRILSDVTDLNFKDARSLPDASESDGMVRPDVQLSLARWRFAERSVKWAVLGGLAFWSGGHVAPWLMAWLSASL
jgi:hypothetical protein